MEEANRPDDVRHYTQLETGALWLAFRAGAGAERDTHLAHAERYARLRLEAADAGGC